DLRKLGRRDTTPYMSTSPESFPSAAGRSYRVTLVSRLVSLVNPPRRTAARAAEDATYRLKPAAPFVFRLERPYRRPLRPSLAREPPLPGRPSFHTSSRRRIRITVDGFGSYLNTREKSWSLMPVLSRTQSMTSVDRDQCRWRAMCPERAGSIWT